MVPDPVFTVNRNWPSWLISTQHGAVCRSANGEDPIDDSVPSAASLNDDTVPEPAPVLLALDTNSWPGLVGRNSLPNGPRPWAGKGDPGAAVRRPPEPTVKLSIWEVPTRVPASLAPSPLNSTSPGWAPSGSATVEPATGVFAAAVTGVGHVHQAAVDRDADRQHAARGDNAMTYQRKRAVGPDPQ